jgi:succinoglycan biosynthesis protein ExoO
MAPDVSIIIAAFNAKDTLNRCIASGLAQTGVTFEIIVTDDCSSDGTPNLLRCLVERDDRLKSITLERNAGPSTARNAAIAHASGEWVAILDADDAMRPHRLRRLMDLSKRRDADIVIDNMLLIPAGAETRDPPRKFVDDPQFLNEQKWDLFDYAEQNVIGRGRVGLGYLKPMIKRSFLVNHRLNYDVSLRNSEDFVLMAECLAQGANVWFTPQPYYLYTLRNDSISARVPPEYLCALIKAEENLRTRHAARLSDQELAALRRRTHSVTRMCMVERIMLALKQHDFIFAARQIYSNPAIITAVFQSLSEAAAKRSVQVISKLL